MKKKYYGPLLFLSVLLLFQSCHIQIENNRRIQVQGTIVDSSGNPIPDISVRTEVGEEILGAAVSDASGNFKFVSLDSQGSGERIAVNLEKLKYGTINYDSQGLRTLQDSIYSGKEYYNGSNEENKLLYDLGTIQLNETAIFILQLNNVPGDSNTLSYQVDYTIPVCQISFGNLGDEETCNNFLDDYFSILDPTSENEELSYNTQLGTEAVFNYSINDGPNETITIPINNPVTTYVFEY